MMEIPRVKIRGFEVAKGWEDRGVQLPEQATAHSAGYDFYIAEDTIIPVNIESMKPTMVATGVKSYMRVGEVLNLYARSSLAKQGLQLSNCVGVVDSDYYSNPDNDGHICFPIWNMGIDCIVVKKGDRIGQGIFSTYLLADQPRATATRIGGFGSSGK